MIITCNECGTSFNVDETLLDAAGNKFRCSVCKEIFFYYPPISGEESTEPLVNTNNADNPNEHSEVVDNSVDSDGGSFGNNSKNMSPTTDHDLDFNPEDIGVELNFKTDHEDFAEDVDLNLGIELDGIEDKADAAELHGKTEDADLSGLEELLDLDGDELVSLEEPADKELAEDVDLNLGLELDGIEDKADAAELHGETEDADLSGLEELLDLDDDELVSLEEPADKELAEDVDLNLDLELDGVEDKADEVVLHGETEDADLSEIEGLLVLDEDGSHFDEKEDVKDIDLSLNQELFDDKENGDEAQGDDENAGEKIELADFEIILGDEDAFSGSNALDAEAGGTALVSEPEDSGEGEDQQGLSAEIDLSDVEGSLEFNENNTDSDEASEDFELELDLDFEETSDNINTDNDTGSLELSDLEALIDDEGSSSEMEPAADEKNIENGIRTPPTGFELDFDMGDEVTEQPETDISLEINFSEYEDKKEVIKETVDDVVQQPETVKPVEVKPEPKVSRKKDYLKKGKTGKVFAILVVLFILTCGSFVGVMLLDTKGTKIMYVTDFVRSVSNILVTQNIYIPYVTDLAKSNNQQDLDGRNKITVLVEPLKGEYIENVKAGLLYVITGQIQNNYDHPRSFVKVTAKLIAKTGTQTENAYCGNILSGIDLENLDLNKIIDHLNNKEGDNKNNINIKAGNNLQFMVVFTNLLEDIEMFNVHIESSSP